MKARSSRRNTRGKRIITGNQLLDLLAERDTVRILAQMERRAVSFRQKIAEEGTLIDQVCFPVNCVISEIVNFEDGVASEISTVGREGMLGLHAFLGEHRRPHSAVCQIDGELWCWDTKSFLRECRRNRRLAELLGVYAEFKLYVLARKGACHTKHKIEQRCAHWLLASGDRAQREEFPMTQEVLARMLGVRRVTVTEVASRLQKRGLIQYRWGKIRIIDRDGLSNAACSCFSALREHYARNLGRLSGLAL